MLRNHNFRKAAALGIITTAVIGVFAAVMAFGTSNVIATPGRSGSCDACHPYPASSLDVTTDAISRTVAPGTVFGVSVSWSGGGTGGAINEINWPTTTQNNSSFSPTPRVPYSGTATSGTTFSTLTAPTTPGTYTVRVFGATGSPFETDYQDIVITVSAPQSTDTTGPVTTAIAVTPDPTVGTNSVTLTASVSDATTGNSNIAAAEYFIDAPGSNGSGITMSASDGNFNAAIEGVRATVSVTGLMAGSHTIYIRGQDAAGNWGTASDGSFTVSPLPDTTGPLASSVSVTPNPTAGATSVTLTASVSDITVGNSSIAAAEYFIDTPGSNGTGTGMTATDGTFNAATENVRATINVSALETGSHTIYVRGRDAAGNWGGNTSVSLSVTAPADTAGPITTNVAVTPNPSGTAMAVTLTAAVSDSTTGNSNIAAAEYFIDTPGSNGNGIAMTASDGSFNAASEGIRATINVTSLTAGSHTLYVHGRDTAGNWGASATVSLTVSTRVDTSGPITTGVNVTPNPTGTATSVMVTATISDATTGESDIDAAEYFFDVPGTNGTGIAMAASDGSFNSANETVSATIIVSGLTVGNHIIYVRGHDAAGNWGQVSSVTFEVQTGTVVKPPRNTEDEDDDSEDESHEDSDAEERDHDSDDPGDERDNDDSDDDDGDDSDDRDSDDSDDDRNDEDDDDNGGDQSVRYRDSDEDDHVDEDDDEEED